MKAQFFILGAVLLCSLFFIGLPPGKPLTQLPLQDMDYILQNLENEFPHALNLGLEEGNPRQTMEDFSSWVRGLTSNFLMNFSSFWVFAEGDPATGNVVVSLGNYMGTDMTVNVNLDGDQRNVFVRDDDSESETFSSVGSTYDLSIQFGNEARSFTWQRDRVSLFVMIELERGENIARRDILA